MKKKLIEVALPLEAINDASAYDKMPGIGPHPKGIHHWWARLPLPAARAILFASLIDDPSCDPRYKDQPPAVHESEREKLFQVIRRLVQKKIHEQPAAIEMARRLIREACGGRLPRFLDPFSGGGSIPLEAARLGLPTNGTDLNPVAVLISRATVDIIPRFANQPPINPQQRPTFTQDATWVGAAGLAQDVRYYSRILEERAKAQIGRLYPQANASQDGRGSSTNVIAWIWARTVECPNPACRVRMPLVRSFVLSTKNKQKTGFCPNFDPETRTISYSVVRGDSLPPKGTITKSGAICFVCKQRVPLPYVRQAGRDHNIEPALVAVVAEGARGRAYVSPTTEQVQIAMGVEPVEGLDTDLPKEALGFRVEAYGLTKHRDLFTVRQLRGLSTISDLISSMHEQVLADARAAMTTEDTRTLEEGGAGARAYADTVSLFLAFALDRCADFNNSLCGWSSSNEKVMHLFGRQVIPMIWDFSEANLLGASVGAWRTCADYVCDCIEVTPIQNIPQIAGTIEQADAASGPLPGAALLVSTDPPYYDNIGYADLSDFFYVWLRRSLGKTLPGSFPTLLVPKREELVANAHFFDGDDAQAKEHFEEGFRSIFARIRGQLDQRFPMTVYYAFKQKDEDADDFVGERSSVDSAPSVMTGWETLLNALISTDFQITATWPIRASQAWRMRSMGSNALASYIVLACRPRPDSASQTSRRDFLSALKDDLPSALRHLQQGGVAPVDLAQAAIGPGMAVFSRYRSVLETDGSTMGVGTALALINQSLDEVLSELESEFDPDTRWSLAWFEQHQFDDGPYGEAEVLATAKALSISHLAEAGMLHSRAGKVRLLRREELSEDWDPSAVRRLTVWEVTQHLIRCLDQKGEKETANLKAKIGGMAEIARDLAYRLYTLCERKGWAEEAGYYNSLVVAWPSMASEAFELS